MEGREFAWPSGQHGPDDSYRGANDRPIPEGPRRIREYAVHTNRGCVGDSAMGWGGLEGQVSGTVDEVCPGHQTADAVSSDAESLGRPQD
jgi:hypothetical protein